MPNMIVPKTLKELFEDYMMRNVRRAITDGEVRELRDAFYAGAFHMAADFNPNHLAELKQYAASKSIVEGIKTQ